VAEAANIIPALAEVSQSATSGPAIRKWNVIDRGPFQTGLGATG
jgi:hypothetical protein